MNKESYNINRNSLRGSENNLIMTHTISPLGKENKFLKTGNQLTP
jgi:hypothetical protein